MGTKGTKVPPLKNIPPKTERELKIALDTIKEALEVRLGRRGDPLDRAVTLRELQDAKVVKVANKEVGVTGGITPPDDPPPDEFTTPPAPATLTASGVFTNIILKWNLPSYGYHGFTEIWRSQANALGGAELLSTAGGQVYVDDVGYNETYFYWVRFVSAENVPGPWNDTEGTSATTAVDIGAVMQSLSENLQNLPGYSTLTTLIDTEAAVAARVIKSSSAPTTRADGSALQANDIWYDTDDGQVHTRNDANNAWVAARDATLVNLFGSTSFTGSTLSGAMATAQGDIVTVTNAQSATASNLSSLTSTVNTNTADIATEQTARANGDSANATLITNLTAVVDVKTQTFIQDNPPTAIAVGDLWIDSNDGNKLYRATATTNSNWVEVTLPGTDAGKATIYTQDNVPTSGVKAGDLWFDTNDSNRQYIAAADGSDQVTSGEWEEVRDVTTQAAVAAEATARTQGDQAEAQARQTLEAKVDLKNQTFVQDNAPTAVATGDLWVDSNDENKLYRWNGSAWVVVRDTANDGKTTVFTQTSQPTAENTGDIWFDTDDSNKQYRWDGSNWVVVRDVLTQAGVTTVQNAIANGTAAEAGYGVAVNANGAVAGMYIMAQSDGTLQNNSSTTSIVFEANQVVIRDTNSGGTNIQPFVVLTSTDSDGNAPGVYINSAFIKNAAITAAQIDSLSAGLVNAVAIDAGSITAGTLAAARLDSSVIVATDLSTGGSTTINGANITTGTIDAARLDADVIVSSDLGSSGSTTIDGSRITTGQIDAARINVTDLVLPAVHNKITGTAVGGFLNNQMRLAQVGAIGTEPGLYQGYVRIYGGTGQVKTLSFAVGDGTYSSTGELDSDNGVYTNGPTNTTLPMVDVGGIQYHSNRAEAWAGIARFENNQAVAQLSVTFRKRSGTSRTANLYVLAQGDGGTRYLDSVEYAFTRLAVNEPIPFTFTDQTGVNTNTVITSNTITLTGAGFTGGTVTLTSAATAQFKVNSGSYQTGSATVATGDTITLQVTSSSSAGTGKSATITCNNVSDTFSVTTAGGGSPPGGGGGGGSPPGGAAP